MRGARLGLRIMLVASSLVSSTSYALTVTAEECREGADFIEHAAQARDGGMTETAFMRQLEADLVAIQSLPETLRWFARDEEDEQLLRTASGEVFQEARDAELHSADFLAMCIARVTQAQEPAPGADAARERIATARD